jgi:hypothetical protein
MKVLAEKTLWNIHYKIKLLFFGEQTICIIRSAMGCWANNFNNCAIETGYNPLYGFVCLWLAPNGYGY